MEFKVHGSGDKFKAFSELSVLKVKYLKRIIKELL